jgi:hypothetical protein
MVTHEGNTGTKIFPIGQGTKYRPVELSSLSGVVSTSFTVTEGNPGGSPDGETLVRISPIRYYQGTGSITSGTIKLVYGADDGVNDPADLRVAQSSSAAGTYVSAGGTGTGSPSGSITSNSISSLGFFRLGSAVGDNPLPVELAAFEALTDFSMIQLTWTTASENNNLGFNIYKTTAGDDSWNKLNSSLIEGQGTVSYSSNYTFVDSKITTGETYQYKLESLSVNGLTIEEKIIEVTVPVPDQYVLFNNYPNPFNPTTNIKFQLPEAQQVKLSIYDLNGGLVTTLINNQPYPSGEHILSWDATDHGGNRVATGIYLYQFQAGKFVKTGKMILVK